MDGYKSSYAKRRVSGAAYGLMVTSAIWGGLLILAIAFDMWLLLSGAVGRLPQQGPVTKETQIAIRTLWGAAMLGANAVILIGALRMKSLQSPGLAKAACVLAVIPCLGPCFIVGLPFGIMGFAALADPKVKRAFRDGYDRDDSEFR